MLPYIFFYIRVASNFAIKKNSNKELVYKRVTNIEDLLAFNKGITRERDRETETDEESDTHTEKQNKQKCTIL